MSKRRKVWRQADQPPRHHRQVDVRPPQDAHVPLIGTLGEVVGDVAQELRQSLPDLNEVMQTPAWWRRVWEEP
jgi:hypothetical protein